MRILIVDPQGFALDWSMRAAKDGHTVKHFIRDNVEKAKYIGRGIVDRVDDFKPWLLWADLVLAADNTKYLTDLDRARADGTPIIAPTLELAQWEVDRTLGMGVFAKHDIDVPPYREFSDVDKAIAYVKKEDRRFVSKPCGEADKAMSYCSKSPVDMIYMLQRWKDIGKLKTPFILQEFIPGIEMAVGGWCGPDGFNVGWCENFEFKKLMNNDMGVATGEQGTVLRYVRTSKLAKKVLAPLTETLVKAGYCGYVDVNCIIDENGTPWPLEFTMRFGWPTFNIQQALHTGDHAEWLLDLWNGKDARNLTLDTIATGVCVSIPDYPYSHLTRKEVVGVPIYGIKGALWDNVHPCEMMMGSAPTQVGGKFLDNCPMLVTAGDYVLVMSGTGSDVKTSADLTYRRLKKLSLPNSPMYRTDIGRRLQKQLPDLHRMGFATGLEYSTTAQP